MTEQEAFIRSVIEVPEDDVRRLVYADWLDEHNEPGQTCRWCDGYGTLLGAGPDRGNPTCPDCHGRKTVGGNRFAERAEFIRVQCRIAELDRDDNYCPDHSLRCAALRQRERELWFGPDGVGGKIRATLPGDHWGIVYDGGPVGDHDNPRAVVRRGFVESITVPTLADLLGGECGRCHGVDGLSIETGLTTCSACPGTGRTPDRLSDIWGRHPVTRVVCGDREPVHDRRYGGLWTWVLDELEIGPASCRIPADLFTRMEELAGNLGANVLEFDSREAAEELLSAAIVSLGRSRAGLPPLTPAEVRS